MAVRFRPGETAYAKDGRVYRVETVEGGTVYCLSSSGAETEFPLSQLLTEAEWATRSGGRPELIYGRLKQARIYAPYKGPFDAAASAQLLAKAERLFPGLLDFTAFTVASREISEAGHADFLPELSITKCRAIFDAATAQTRAVLLAGLLGAVPEVLVGAARLGDNLMRAMIDKGLAPNSQSFEAFGARRRL